jgi:hypothetical protein
MHEDPSTFPRRHTTPTHLDTPDKILFGLTARQLFLLLLGISLSYSLWLHLGWVIPTSWLVPGLLLRLLCALPPVLLSLVIAFVTVAERPLELWAIVGLRYLVQPKTAVWQRPQDRRGSARSSASGNRGPASRLPRRHLRVQSLLPLREVAEEVLSLQEATGSPSSREPSYAAVLQVQATNFTLKSPEEQQALIDGYRAFLLALRFPVQILVRSQRMELSSYLARLDASLKETEASAPKDGAPSQALRERQRLAQIHRRTIEELSEQRTLLDRRFYLIVPTKAQEPLPWYAVLPFIGKRIRTQHHHRSLTQAKQELASRVASLSDHLSGIGLSSHRLAGKELAALYDQCVRGEEASRYPFSPTLFRETTRGAGGAKDTTEAPEEQEQAEASLSPEELFAPVRSWEEEPEADLTDEGHEGSPIRETLSQTQPPAFLSLPDVLSPSCIQVSADHVRVGEEYVRGIAVIGLPREVIDGAATPLIQLDEIMQVIFHLSPQDTGSVLRRLLQRQAQYRSTSKITQRRGGSEDPDLSVAEADLERLLPALASGQERLIEVGFYVLARARSVEALKMRTARILSTVHNGLLSAHQTTLEHLEAFLAALPTGRDPLGRSLTTTCTALATMLPFVSDQIMMPEGILLGISASGEPVLLDPWGAGMDNPHEFWGGISGAGKSFAIKLRIIHELLVHPQLQVVVIDPAGEYHKLVRAMGGRTIRMAPGSAQSINPFDLLPAGVDLERYVREHRGDRLAEKIHNLHSFLDILLSDYTPTPTTLKAQEKSLLDRVLYEAYRRVGITADPRTHGRPAPLLRDVYEVLRDGVVGQDGTGLAERLERFVSGSMAGLFSRPTNVALDARLLHFDLREMRGGSEIKPAGVFLISEFLWTQALYHPRPRRCYIDEAWSLIEHQEGGAFLERMAREFRKHYVSLVTITQNPEQFVNDARGSVIAQNAFTKVLKRLDTIGSRAARTAFGLSEAEERRLTTLEQKKALLMVGSKRLIVEITASREEYVLAATDPGEALLPRLEPPHVVAEAFARHDAPGTEAALPIVLGKPEPEALPPDDAANIPDTHLPPPALPEAGGDGEAPVQASERSSSSRHRKRRNHQGNNGSTREVQTLQTPQAPEVQRPKGTQP